MVNLSETDKVNLSSNLVKKIEKAEEWQSLPAANITHFMVKVSHQYKLSDLHQKYHLPKTFEVHYRRNGTYVTVTTTPEDMTVGNLVDMIRDKEILGITNAQIVPGDELGNGNGHDR